MREFKKLPLELFIGYDIEQNSRVIELDASEMVEKYPSGILQLVCKRPGEETTYIAPSFEQDGGTLRWTLTSYDVEKAGQGLAIVALVDTSEESVKVLASHKIRTGIEEGLHFRDAESVDPEDSLIARVLAAVSQAQAYAQDAKEEADRAGAALDDVEDAKDQAISDIETKGQETLDSIPSDYTTLSGDVSDLKSAIEMYDVTKSRLLYYGNYETKSDNIDYPLVSKNTDAKMCTFCIRASSFGEITNNYAIGYKRFRADGTVIQQNGIKQSNVLNGFVFTVTSATTAIEIYVNSGGVASTIENLEIWESKIDCVVLPSPKTFNVAKDGSGDFTSIVSAVNYARFYYGSTLYIGPGEWDIVDELGADYIESISSTQRGIILDNGIHLIFNPKAIVRCEYTGSTAQTIRWLSAFNSGKYGFTLENAVIYSSNCLYTIHDERGGSTDFYINKYINCQFYHNNPVHFQCIGGGLGLEGYIIISGCYFECTYLTGIDGAGAIVTYHNNATANSKSKINISNCYFAGKTGIKFGYYGASTEKSIMYVNNTSIGRRATNGIIVEAENADATINNVEVLQWLNEFRLDITTPH